MNVDQPTRRIEITLHKPRFALYFGVRPTIVMDERGQPAQWGVGTWQIPSDRTTTVSVFLFNRLWRFGDAQFTVASDVASLTYRAPALPFLRGKIRSQPRGSQPT